MAIKMKVWLLRNLVVMLVVIITFLVLAGSMMNENNHKFSRSRNTPCTHGILVLNEADSHTCCASPHHANSWVCIASFDYMNNIISSKLAFVIPLLPLFANVVFAGDWRGKRWLKRLLVYLALFILRTVRCVRDVLSRILHFKSSTHLCSTQHIFYCALFYCTQVVLYLIPYYIQEWVQSSSSQSMEDCWCRAFVSETKYVHGIVFYNEQMEIIVWGHCTECNCFNTIRRCKMHFDFSDHIVLNVVQYMLPCVLELHYSLSRVLNLDNNAVNNGSNGGSTSVSGGTNNKTHSMVEGRFGTVLMSTLRSPHCAHISMTISVVLLCISARSLLLTGMFFHTYAENAVGYAIAAVVAAAPLYSNSILGLWANRVLD